jgi:hypothetical protein
MAKQPKRNATQKKKSKRGKPTRSSRAAAAQAARSKKLPGIPHEVHDHLSRLADPVSLRTPMVMAAKSFSALGSDEVAPAQLTDVTFTINPATTATLTRVHLQGDPNDIVNNTRPQGILPRQVVGTFVTVVIEVTGAPDAVGVIDVQHASPGSFRLAVSHGPVGTKPLFITG